MKEARFTEEELVKLLKPFYLRDRDIVRQFLTGDMGFTNTTIQARNMVVSILQTQITELKEIQKLSEGTVNLKCQSVIETFEALIQSLNKVTEANQRDFDKCRSFERLNNISTDELKEANSVESLQTLDDKFWEKWNKVHKYWESKDKEFLKEAGVNTNPSSNNKPE